MIRGLLTILIFFFLCQASSSETTDYRSCMDCHNGIERMDKNHAFPCEECHILPHDRGRAHDTHDRILRHPAAPEYMDTFCGECHRKEITRLRNSLHYTLAGVIGQTRYLWGAQENPVPKYSPSGHPELGPLPTSPNEPESPADLVDDLLRRRCFTCHLGQLPPRKKGRHRGLGCSACHVFYADDGIYRGDDKTIKGKAGYPRAHSFTAPIPVRQCLHCHNGPRVGADYAGLFEHDYHWSYRTPWRAGSVPEPIYIADHHHLSPDVHYQKGLLCVDCHEQGDVMGRGRLLTHRQEAVKVRCEKCHGPSPTGPEIGGQFQDRQGRRHPLPRWDKSVPGHNIPGMKNLHCTSCHAQWGFYDYGLSLIRDDRKDLSRWAPWRMQGDERVMGLFDDRGRFLGSDGGLGPWFSGWGFRRWEYLTLGVDGDGRIVPFRPHYQYMISFVDKKGSVLLDSVTPQRGDKSGPGWAYMPFYPHTVRKRGRPCEDCHGQALAAGKGLGESWGQDLSLTRASRPVYPDLRLLRAEEMERLVKKTPLFRHTRSRILLMEMKEDGVPSPDKAENENLQNN